jgi:hypothetical protein
MINNQPTSRGFLYKLGGYYLIPHELLHVLAYCLIGKPCHYEWGNYYVSCSINRTRGEKIFVLLFPTMVCLGLGFLFHLLWGISLLFVIRMPLEKYFFDDGPTWHLTLPVIATLLIIYSGNGYGDVINVYRLLLRKDKPQHNGPKPH